MATKKKAAKNPVTVLITEDLRVSESEENRLGKLWMSGPPDVSRISWQALEPIKREDLMRPDVITDRTLELLNARRRGQVVLYIDGKKAAVVEAQWVERIKKLMKSSPTKKAV